VYGEWRGAPGAPTLLVYGHYDVQPVDPVELWSTPPFGAVVRNGKIFARGASDNKGQFLAHVLALESHLRSHGSCPVNVKFLIEGEEEIGSPNLGAFIAKQRSLLACDVAVVSDSAMFAKGQPAICYGLRGLAYLELRVQGTDRDLHSGSYGGAVVNPANALVRLLASLKDDKGRVTVPGFYEKVRRLGRSETKALRRSRIPTRATSARSARRSFLARPATRRSSGSGPGRPWTSTGSGVASPVRARRP